MFAAQIDNGLIVGLATTGFSMFCLWASWITLATARSADHGRRLDRLEERVFPGSEVRT